MKKIGTSLAILFTAGLNPVYASVSSLIFDVNTNGVNLVIKTNIPNHIYPAAGIKILTPGVELASSSSGCTLAANGYCLFQVSDTLAANIVTTGAATEVAFILCLNGNAALSCQNYTRSLNTSSLVTVGYYRKTDGLYNPISYTSATAGQTWALSASLPLPSDTLQQSIGVDFSGLNSVTCDSTEKNCVSVGEYARGTSLNYTTYNGRAPFSYTSNNGGQTWTLSPSLILPADTLIFNGSNEPISALNSVTCDVTGQFCSSVGYYLRGAPPNYTVNNGFVPLSYTSSNGGQTWLLSSSLPLPTDVRQTANANTRLNGVTCDLTGKSCLAVGFYPRGTGTNSATPNGTVPLSYTSSDGGQTWVLRTPLPLPADAQVGNLSNARLAKTTCDSIGQYCLAVGNYSTLSNGFVPLSYISTDGGQTWTLSTTLPLPTDALISALADNRLFGITCNSTGQSCIAVGFYSTASGGGASLNYTSSNGGQSWVLSAALPLPNNAALDNSSFQTTFLTSVKCTNNALQCTALGQYAYIGSINNNALPLSYTSGDGGKNWSLSDPLPLASNIDPVPDSGIRSVH